MSDGIKDSAKPGSSARWAALDSQLERLASAADWSVTDPDDEDRDSELRVAS
ncbi:MAG TPA: hypothetical protein VMR14_08420 [Streptosporangiaceae bacterium]|jgi:hypothetical protein|nr:hypothetical protein [Streptosporangiaceae bacterium]